MQPLVLLRRFADETFEMTYEPLRGCPRVGGLRVSQRFVELELVVAALVAAAERERHDGRTREARELASGEARHRGLAEKRQQLAVRVHLIGGIPDGGVALQGAQQRGPGRGLSRDARSCLLYTSPSPRDS